jgi:hypothetical protein
MHEQFPHTQEQSPRTQEQSAYTPKRSHRTDSDTDKEPPYIGKQKGKQKGKKNPEKMTIGTLPSGKPRPSKLGTRDAKRLYVDTNTKSPHIDKKEKVTMGPVWDRNMASPFLNTFDGKTVRQYWYDDAASTSLKYAWARKIGLRGVGPYRFDMVGQIGEEDASSDMWQALEAFWGGSESELDVRVSEYVKQSHSIVTTS